MEKIKGYKGFDNDLKCRDFQYELGGKYEEEEVSICNKGFHFCEYPLDVFGYYQPSGSRFTEVEGSGKTDKRDNEDSKIACTKIKIGIELAISGLVDAAVKFVFDRADWSKNDKTSDRGSQSDRISRGSQSDRLSRGRYSYWKRISRKC